jgi:vacuolar-type H+-ATPase subunit H
VANGDSIGIKQWGDAIKEINKQFRDAEENVLEVWQETLQRAHDIFEEEMDNIVKEFEDGISPIYGSIEALQDAITRANELND